MRVRWTAGTRDARTDRRKTYEWPEHVNKKIIETVTTLCCSWSTLELFLRCSWQNGGAIMG
jgi:hypothetical protein